MRTQLSVQLKSSPVTMQASRDSEALLDKGQPRPLPQHQEEPHETGKWHPSFPQRGLSETLHSASRSSYPQAGWPLSAVWEREVCEIPAQMKAPDVRTRRARRRGWNWRQETWKVMCEVSQNQSALRERHGEREITMWEKEQELRERREMVGNTLRQTQGKRDTRGTEGSKEEMRTEAEVEQGPREIQSWVCLLVKGRTFSVGQSPPPMSLAWQILSTLQSRALEWTEETRGSEAWTVMGTLAPQSQGPESRC